MIEVRELAKRYGGVTAVRDLSFTVRPGRVTGFLGPNGAGKSTTMRVILGLHRPSAGAATVNGRPYAAHPNPLRQVGALMEITPAHGGRTAYQHLLALARTHGISPARVIEVLELAGLSSAAGRRVGGFSMGMRRQLVIIGRGRLPAETSVAELIARAGTDAGGAGPLQRGDRPGSDGLGGDGQKPCRSHSRQTQSA
jgi:ABC-2 type transport system ATP-binding protein